MPNSLFIRPIYQRIRPVYRQNRLVLIGWEFHCSYFQSNGFRSVFIEFGWFFKKPMKSEGANFLVSTGFLNTGCAQPWPLWAEPLAART
jgi:hypothetical protein